MKKTKRVSNNPNGRPTVDDKKIMLGMYIRQSDIDVYGGKDGMRKAIKEALHLRP